MRKFKLIKEYPGSPKLGAIVDMDVDEISYLIVDIDEEQNSDCTDLSLHPEYWEEIKLFTKEELIECVKALVKDRFYTEDVITKCVEEWIIKTRNK